MLLVYWCVIIGQSQVTACNTNITSTRPLIANANDGQNYPLPGEDTVLKIQTNSIDLFDIYLHGSITSQFHVDYSYDQFYRILEGTFELRWSEGFSRNDQTIHGNNIFASSIPNPDLYVHQTAVLTVGDTVLIPKGCIFQFYNRGEGLGHLFGGFVKGGRFNLVKELSIYYANEGDHASAIEILEIERQYCVFGQAAGGSNNQ